MFDGALKAPDIDPLVVHGIDTVVVKSHKGLVSGELSDFHNVGDLFLYFVSQNLCIAWKFELKDRMWMI